MNPTAQKYGAGALAGVNLIPVEIADRKKMRGVVTAAVFAVLIAVGAVVVVFSLTLVGRLAVQADRDNAAKDEQAAVAERDGKSQIYSDVRAREQEEYTLAQIGYGEIDYAQLTASIQRTADNTTSFDAIRVVGPNGQGTPVTENEEGTTYGAGIGMLEFLARAETVEDAHALLARLEAVPGLANVRATTESVANDGAEPYWQVEGTAALTDLLLTNRLLPLNGISGVAGIVAPAIEPEPSASPSPSPEPSATEEG